MKYKGKETINTLLNIDSIFGEHEGRVLPIVIIMCLIALPLLIWLFLLQGTPIKLLWVVLFDIPWSVYWILEIKFDGKGKRKFYMEQKSDKGVSADEIIHIKDINENGLIMYDNGFVGFIISGYIKTYLNDDKLSVEIENFMNELDMWDWDMYLHNTTDELLCENDLPKLKRYKDRQVIKERISMLTYQDEYTRTHTGLYRISFLVTTQSYNWKKLESHLFELITSEVALCFNEVKVLNYEEVSELCGRDIYAFINIRKMLMSKYDNDDYHKSKVLWYDDNITEDLKKKVDRSNLEERRM